MSTIRNTLSYQDDFDCVLQLAEDELSHLKDDAILDPDSANDYLDSKAALKRVRESWAQLERMTDEEYCRIEGAKCPYCRSKDIKVNHTREEPGGGILWRIITCSSCRIQWEEYYLLTGYREEIKPKPLVFVRDGTSDTRYPQEEEDG